MPEPSALTRRAPVKRSFLAGLALHTLAVAWLWTRYGEGARAGLVVWMDLPWSLAYLGARSDALLATSLALGGLWWGLLGALFARWLGALARRGSPAGR